MPPPATRRGQAAAPPAPKDRRLPAEAGGLRRLWRWMKGWLRRPIGLVGAGGHRRLGFVERRKRPADALSVAGMRSELRQRLLTLPPERAEQHFSHLVQVHDELGRKGWAGVGALPASVLARALIQADELRREAPNPAMKQLVDKLRTLQPPPPAPAPAAKGEAVQWPAVRLLDGRPLPAPWLAGQAAVVVFFSTTCPSPDRGVQQFTVKVTSVNPDSKTRGATRLVFMKRDATCPADSVRPAEVVDGQPC